MYFVFSIFLLVCFFPLFSFLYFLAWGTATMKRPPPPASFASSGAVSGSFSSMRSSPPSFFFSVSALAHRPSFQLGPPPAAFSLSPFPLHASSFPIFFAFSPFFSPSLFTSQSPFFFPIPPPHLSLLRFLHCHQQQADLHTHSRPQIIKIPSQGAKPGCGLRERSERAGARSSAGSRSAVRSERRPPGSRPESSLQ